MKHLAWCLAYTRCSVNDCTCRALSRLDDVYDDPAMLEPSHVPFPLSGTLLTPIFPEPFPSPLSGLGLNVTFWTVRHTPSYLQHPVQGRAHGRHSVNICWKNRIKEKRKECVALPTPWPAAEGEPLLSSCLLGRLPELCKQQALNPCFQTDLNLCSVQQTFPGHRAPGRTGQAAASPGGAVGLQSLEAPSPLFNLAERHPPGPPWLCFCLPDPTSLSPAGQLRRFQRPPTPCPSQHLKALCHQQVPAVGPGFPSCDRIRKRLRLFPDTLYGQPWSPEQGLLPQLWQKRGTEGEDGQTLASSHTGLSGTLALPSLPV